MAIYYPTFILPSFACIGHILHERLMRLLFASVVQKLNKTKLFLHFSLPRSHILQAPVSHKSC